MDQYVKDMRVRILSDAKNREGLMQTHKDLIKAVRDKDIRLGHDALDRHYIYIYQYLDSWLNISKRDSLHANYQKWEK